MLQRLHVLQGEMHDQFLKDEAAKAEEAQRNFSQFGSPSKLSCGVSPVKGIYSSKSPSREDLSAAPPPTLDKKEKHTSPEKLIAIKEQKEDVAVGDKCFEIETKPADEHVNTVLKPLQNCENILVDDKTTDNDTRSKITDTGGENEDKSRDPQVSYSQIPCSSKDKSCTDLIGNEEKIDMADLDSEDEERKEDITLEDRRARIKRALSPSFHREDAFTHKKPRLRNDSFRSEWFWFFFLTSKVRLIRSKKQMIPDF